MQTRSQISARMRRLCAPLLFMAFDYLAILFAEKMAFELHEIYGMIVGRTFYVPFSYLLFWIPLVFIAFLWGMQTYTKMQPVLETVRKIFYAVLYSMIACILALYFMQAGLLASRLYVVLFGCLALVSIYAVRYILLKLLKATHTLTKPVILIGAGKTAEQVLHFFDGDLGYRYEVIGILDDHPISKTLPQQFQLMGTLADAKTIIRSSGVDTVITHPPLNLRGTAHVAATDPKGRTVHRLIRAGIALLNAHTSLDAAHGGVADALAERVGLVSTVPLEPDPASPDQGIGRIGMLPQPVTLRRLAEDVASALPDSAPGLLVGGDLDAVVERIAVSGGAGDSLLQRARQAGADVFLTADLRHHPASEHLEDGRPYLLCGTHWATEWVGLEPLARRLTEDAHTRGASLCVQVSRIVTDPWALRLPTGPDRA